MVFLLIPEYEVRYDWFPFSDQRIFRSTYVHFLFGKIATIWSLWLAAREIPKFVPVLVPMLTFAVIDFVDFLLTCNDIFWEVGIFPVSWNTVGAFVILVWVWANDE